MSTRFRNTQIIILFLACLATALTLLAQSLPPIAGFGSGKQAITAGEDELKTAEAKRAWLFLEYPQLALVPEPPAQGTFYSLQKVQPPLPFLPIEGLPIYSWADGNYFYDDLDYPYPLRRSDGLTRRSGGVMEMSDPSPPGEGGGGGTNETSTTSVIVDHSNETRLWLEIFQGTTNIGVLLHNSEEGRHYQLLTKDALTNTSWNVETNLYGTTGQNWTTSSIYMGSRTSLFVVAFLPASSNTSMPFFDTPGGTYLSARSVRVYNSSPGAEIHYTLNGSTPTLTNATISHGDAINITNGVTLKAKAWLTGRAPSAVASATYDFAVETPALSVAGGIYVPTVNVSVFCVTEGAILRYTTNGIDPTTNSPIVVAYEDVILITNSTLLKVKAWLGSLQSGVRSATYTIVGPPANDHGTNAQAITGVTGVVYGRNIGATSEEDEECYFGSPSLTPYYSIWYDWTAPTNGTVVFNTQGSEFNTELFAFRGTNFSDCWDNLTLVGSNDDDGDLKTSLVSFSATNGVHYRIGVYSHDGAQGGLHLSWAMGSQAETPTFSPGAGIYTNTQLVSISCPTPNAVIHYTLSGDDPTLNDPAIVSGSTVFITDSYTLKASAWVSGMVTSAVASAVYVINPAATNATNLVIAPTFSPMDSSFTNSLSVTISSATSGADIHYTTDGREPTLSDATITSGSSVTLSQTQVLKAKGWKTGSGSSAVQEATYAKAGSDADLDGIPDDWERLHGSKVFQADARAESTEAYAHGLNNLQVYQNQSVLLADNYSTASDGLPDWWKIQHAYSLSTTNLGSSIGNNGQPVASSYQGGFDPTDPNSKPGVADRPEYKIVRGPQNNLYLFIDRVDPEVFAHRLFLTPSDLPTTNSAGLVNGQTYYFDLFPTNGQRIFELSSASIPFGGTFNFQIIDYRTDGTSSPPSGPANTSIVGIEHRAFLNYSGQMRDRLIWKLRFIGARHDYGSEGLTPGRWPMMPLPCWYSGFASVTNTWVDSFDTRSYPQTISPADDPIYIGDFVDLYRDDVTPELDPEGQPTWLSYFPWSYWDLRETSLFLGADFIGMTNNVENLMGLKYLSFDLVFDDTTIHLTPGTTSTISVNDASYAPAHIYQKTETPILLTTNYSFARSPSGFENSFGYGNVTFATPELPDDLVTEIKTKTNALVVVGVNEAIRINAWSHEAIQHTNGTFVASRFGYLQQYFDKAYLCDPATGDVPRGTNANVGGKMKINTTTAKQSGILSPYGDFVATEPGKYILTTLTNGAGQYGECVVYALGIGVDANRDGKIDSLDVTTASKPFTFWVNNDIDRGHSVDCIPFGNCDFEEDDLEPLTDRRDFEYHDSFGKMRIPSKRDLEDYTRLWLPGFASFMKDMSNSCSVELTWRGQGLPGINLFTAVETNGGSLYLSSTNTANEQNSTLTTFVGTVKFDQNILLSERYFIMESWRSKLRDYYLFCGTQRGKGELVLRVKQGGTLIGEASAFLDIKDVKEMYEHWTVGVATNPGVDQNIFPAGSPTLKNKSYAPSHNEAEKDYILFVHGWNLSPWEKEAFAETAYKRLYWQGYKGRFGFFSWPTFWATGVPSPDSYNKSEYNCWNSAPGLVQLLIDLNNRFPDRVRVFAHSMGNVVTGEALGIAGVNGAGGVVNTYVASQAAIPAHVYDPTTPTNSAYAPFGFFTPNVYRQYWTNGAPAYLQSSAGAITMINYYNEEDYALIISDANWEANQALKPYLTYNYSTNSGFHKTAIGGLTNYLVFPNDTYEIFALAAQARSHPLGAQPNVGGVFSAQLNLSSTNSANAFGGDFAFGRDHKGHSGQFRSTIMYRSRYWDNLLQSFKLKEAQ